MTMRLLIRLLTALALVSPITGGALPAAAQDKVRLLLD
jgi:putative hydroxymethylpyrimidine transport system substrate-binding protein